jgi:hypothetical protein
MNVIILLALPIIIIHVILVFFSLYDLFKKRILEKNFKIIWTLIIIFINIIGPVIYLVFSKNFDQKEE